MDSFPITYAQGQVEGFVVNDLLNLKQTQNETIFDIPINFISVSKVSESIAKSDLSGYLGLPPASQNNNFMLTKILKNSNYISN